MNLVTVDPLDPDPEALSRAGEILRNGGLVAFPTETVYGLGANALDQTAVTRIFDAKGRPAYNPLIVHVADGAAAQRLTAAWPDVATVLARKFWPGPLTLVLPKAATVPDIVTAGLPSVALRVPAHPLAHALLRAAGVPVAAPSANRFTELSPTTAAHVRKGLGDRVDVILDGGPTNVGIESTVLDLTGDHPTLLRPGSISASEIESLIGPIGRAGDQPAETARPAPGMLDRHYSPKAQLRLYPSGSAERILSDHARETESGLRVGVILTTSATSATVLVRVLSREPDVYARDLYATLHDLDELGCEAILVEAPPEQSAWDGVRDRLRRAAHQG
ncbi:L-threonylcarbamoyladenylate synthase [soil metagenome]